MPACPVCNADQPRLLARSFPCKECGTELALAGSTIWAALLTVIPVMVAVVLAKPWIGRGGVIALGLIAGHLLPWVCFVVFYRLEPAGTELNLNDRRRNT